MRAGMVVLVIVLRAGSWCSPRCWLGSVPRPRPARLAAAGAYVALKQALR